jgi:hypothetical protein
MICQSEMSACLPSGCSRITGKPNVAPAFARKRLRRPLLIFQRLLGMIDDEDVHGGEMFGEPSPVNDPQRTQLGREANPFVVFAAGRRFEAI